MSLAPDVEYISVEGLMAHVVRKNKPQLDFNLMDARPAVGKRIVVAVIWEAPIHLDKEFETLLDELRSCGAAHTRELAQKLYDLGYERGNSVYRGED
jgi:hypothetical protein